MVTSSEESQQFPYLDTLYPESSVLARYFIKTSFEQKKLSCKTFFFAFEFCIGDLTTFHPLNFEEKVCFKVVCLTRLK